MEKNGARRYTFPGLPIKAIVHPEEEGMLKKVLQNKSVGGLLEKANVLNVEFFSGVVQGSYVRISDETAPEFFRVLRDVCQILNYPDIPGIYVTHLMAQAVLPCGSDRPYLIVADFVLDTFDEDMLYYIIGNAITMYKAGHADLSNLLNSPGLQVPLPLRLVLLAYMRTADMTSDRGGLLACQSFAAALRCHLQELGMPVSETYRLFHTDEEAERYAEDYLEEVERVKGRYGGFLENVTETLQNWTYFEGPANKMLSELFKWYKDKKGYPRILRTQGRPVEAQI